MKKPVVIVLLVLLIFSLFWFFYPLRSYIVMSVYSASHARQSVLRQNGFEIYMPSFRGWYPFVMTFNADGFARYSGADAQMSILYNFGAFDLIKRTSSVYDKDSDKYSSFYGAYVIEQSDGIFGFDESGKVDMGEVELAVKYDYTKLVIENFGCSEQIFIIDDFDLEENLDYIGIEGWTKLDAALTVNGAAHNYAGYKNAYLQYGRPIKKVSEDFEETQVFGRLYMRFFEEYGCTVMIYIIAPDRDAVLACDELLSEKTIIAPLS